MTALSQPMKRLLSSVAHRWQGQSLLAEEHLVGSGRQRLDVESDQEIDRSELAIDRRWPADLRGILRRYERPQRLPSFAVAVATASIHCSDCYGNVASEPVEGVR